MKKSNHWVKVVLIAFTVLVNAEVIANSWIENVTITSIDIISTGDVAIGHTPASCGTETSNRTWLTKPGSGNNCS